MLRSKGIKRWDTSRRENAIKIIEFFQRPDWEQKVQPLIDELSQFAQVSDNSGLRYLQLFIDRQTTNMTYRELGQKYGGVSLEYARQMCDKGRGIFERNVLDTPEMQFYRDLYKYWAMLEVNNYPLFMRMYHSLMRNNYITIKQVHNMCIPEMKQVKGLGYKAIDYLTSMQYFMTHEEEMNKSNEVEIIVHPVRNL